MYRSAYLIKAAVQGGNPSMEDLVRQADRAGIGRPKARTQPRPPMVGRGMGKGILVGGSLAAGAYLLNKLLSGASQGIQDINDRRNQQLGGAGLDSPY